MQLTIQCPLDIPEPVQTMSSRSQHGYWWESRSPAIKPAVQPPLTHLPAPRSTCHQQVQGMVVAGSSPETFVCPAGRSACEPSFSGRPWLHSLKAFLNLWSWDQSKFLVCAKPNALQSGEVHGPGASAGLCSQPRWLLARGQWRQGGSCMPWLAAEEAESAAMSLLSTM